MPRSNRYYEYIISMIKGSDYEDRKLIDKFLSEDPNNKKSLFFKIRNIAESVAPTKIDDYQAYQILAEAVSDYLCSYRSSYIAKQRLYSRLYAWCKYLGEQHKIDGYNDLLDDIVSPLKSDIAVETVKRLHDRQGVSKTDLANDFDLSPKSIQVCLSKIDNPKHHDPLRIGGQAIHVPITRKKSNVKDGEWKYYTENTLSPLVFQMNIMQVATLMKSLQLNYANGNDIPLDLAVDTWSQLSVYAKERIREVFGKRDAEFDRFLNEVERNLNDDEYRFMSEPEMMKGDNVNISEQLLIADKGGMVCDILLYEPLPSRKNQRIIFDHTKESYYAVPASDPNSSDRLYFTEDDVIEIEEV